MQISSDVRFFAVTKFNKRGHAASPIPLCPAPAVFYSGHIRAGRTATIGKLRRASVCINISPSAKLFHAARGFDREYIS